MEQNVLKKVAEKNGVSEQEVRSEIGAALASAEGFKADGEMDLDSIIRFLAEQVKAEMRRRNYFVEKTEEK